MKNRLGYTLFPGDYAIKIDVHNHYDGQDIYAYKYLITELIVNGIVVAKLKSHTEEKWIDGYPEDILYYDDVDLINSIKYYSGYDIKYAISEDRGDDKVDIVDYSELIPINIITDIASKIKKEGENFKSYYNNNVKLTK